MTKQRILAKLRLIAKSHSVTVRFHKFPKDYDAYYCGDKKTIVVVYVTDRSWFLSAFFHELAHVLSHRDGLHAGFYGKRATKANLKRLALRAERHTDKRAKKICKEYFPDIMYKNGYDSKAAAEYLRDYYGYEDVND